MPKKPPRNNPPRTDRRTIQSASSLLQRISQKAAAERSLIEQLRSALPEELRPHLTQVLEKPGELVLFADSAVWAGRLKLAAEGLSVLAAGRRQVVRVMPRGGYRR